MKSQKASLFENSTSFAWSSKGQEDSHFLQYILAAILMAIIFGVVLYFFATKVFP